MDQKTWLWRKKSADKVIAAATEKVNASSKASEDEMHKLVNEKVELEREFIALNDRLTDALSELYAKDDLIKKHEKMVWDATTGWENAEAKVLSLKEELDEAFHSRIVGEERMAHLEAALKECMQQLRFVRDEQEQRIHDAVLKTTREFERSQLILEEKLEETTAMLTRISAENTQLTKALLAKEKFADDLSKQKARMEVDFNSLVKKLESAEKDNSSLMYEVRLLQKELDIRSEEKEFNQRTADASHKQHLESVKKIAKLEAECQRLRVLVRKRLPGPAALAKMKAEVEILGRDGIDARRRRSNSNQSGFSLGYAADNSSDSKRISFLTEQLCAIEEENKSLREALNKKANELQFSRSMYARTASKLSQAELHLEDLSKGHSILESSASGHVPQELSLASMSDIGSEDKVSCAGSWASALISELEHFKSGRHRGSPSSRTVGASDINLMDDFAEMERLAIVSVDKQCGSPHASSVDTATNTGLLEADLNGYFSDVTSKDIVSISDFGSGTFNDSKDVATDKSRSWLHGVVKDIWEQHCVTQRRPDQILEDVRLALRSLHPESIEAKESVKVSEVTPLPSINGFSYQRHEVSAITDVICGATNVQLVDKSNQLVQSDFRQSLCNIIELIEGIKPYSTNDSSESMSRKDGSSLPHNSTEVAPGYMVRVFQWKVSELSPVLQQFVHSCYDLLNGKSNWTRFTQELNVALEWIMNHCFSIQDVSSMKDAIKKHLDWDETRSECEAEVGTVNQASELDKSSLSNGQFSFLPIVASSNEKSKNEPQGSRYDQRLNDEIIHLESAKKEFEGRLQSAVEKGESLANQLQDSERTIESLRMELQTLRGSSTVAENQIENHKLMKEDLSTQLTVAKAELNDTRQRFSCLEVELENKSCCCEELEATCLDLQLQLESVKKEALPVNQVDQEESQLRNDWEINAASAKLAECQETILNLGKQIKAMASPRDAAMFDKVIPKPSKMDGTPATASAVPATTTPGTTATASSVDVIASKNEIVTQRSSLLDRMMEEDDIVENDTPSTKIKESGKHSHPTFVTNEVIDHLEKILMLDGSRSQKGEVGVKSLALVPSKRKGGGSLWKKLWRKKKSGSKKPSLPFAA